MHKPELIVALDLPDARPVADLVSALPARIRFYKIGLELFAAEGPAVLDALRRQKKRIFLDLKLHDIPRTVAHAVRAVGRLGVDLLTVHALGGRAMLTAAAEAARALGPVGPRLIAVTTLTSLDDADFADLGISRTLDAQARALGALALGCGVDGLVTSAHELPALRKALGPRPLLVTPGIRPAHGDAGDQKRIATPAIAVRGGASHLVVGRPILDASDPVLAAQQILDEMAAACAKDSAE